MLWLLINFTFKSVNLNATETEGMRASNGKWNTYHRRDQPNTVDLVVVNKNYNFHEGEAAELRALVSVQII